MTLGLSLSTFTTVHVVLSLIGIATGFIVLIGLFRSDRIDGWAAIFLATTVLTSATGFLFPFVKFGPAHVVGVISLVALAVALLALYAFGLAGAWRWLYVVGAVLALYLNVFVGVTQAFQKLAFLNRFAPTQSEPPFLVAQFLVLALFVAAGIAALRAFHPERSAS